MKGREKMFLACFMAFNWQSTLAWLISSVLPKIITQPLGRLTYPLHKTHTLKVLKL